mgnify:CR=1 FL=1
MLDSDFKKINIAIIGLGYVGLPLAVEFSKKFNVIGFDINSERVSELKKGYDRTLEIAKESILQSQNLTISNDELLLTNVDIYIITVPTPIDKNKNPDLNPLISSSKTVGRYLKKNNIVIYESTVFPGATEQICIPILEEESSLIYNKDFFCGYSPERINPGDAEHSLKNVIKVTSGSTRKVAEYIDRLYSLIIDAGTYMAESIMVAEAAKVIENTQRDVNIALINELSIIFNKLEIDTKQVLDAAETKWNFLPFKPGLVGGHCIGVDPYYLTHKAIEVGYYPEMILAGRKINESIGEFVADTALAILSENGVSPLSAKIGVLGVTFKENCPDLRNSNVMKIIERLKKFQCKISLTDEFANENEVKKYFSHDLLKIDEVRNQDVIIVSVAHDHYKNFNNKDWRKMLKSNGVVIDVKSIYDYQAFKKMNIRYWRL